MKKYYQTTWHGIKFSDFTRTNVKKIADASFYQLFYKEFFERYTRWDELPLRWRNQKKTWASFIQSRINNGNILSVGCGLGYTERVLQQLSSGHVYIHEVAASAWQWITNEFPHNKKLLGSIPDCLPSETIFDLIYITAVDYALNNDDLVCLLSSLRPFLKNGKKQGECLLISASFLEVPETIKHKIRGVVKIVLSKIGLYEMGQFWGWQRTQNEYRLLMQKAGYEDIKDGFIENREEKSYWISGQ